jgi:hypothetical protein
MHNQRTRSLRRVPKRMAAIDQNPFETLSVMLYQRLEIRLRTNSASLC